MTPTEPTEPNRARTEPGLSQEQPSPEPHPLGGLGSVEATGRSQAQQARGSVGPHPEAPHSDHQREDTTMTRTSIIITAAQPDWLVAVSDGSTFSTTPMVAWRTTVTEDDEGHVQHDTQPTWWCSTHMRVEDASYHVRGEPHGLDTFLVLPPGHYGFDSAGLIAAARRRKQQQW